MSKSNRSGWLDKISGWIPQNQRTQAGQARAWTPVPAAGHRHPTGQHRWPWRGGWPWQEQRRFRLKPSFRSEVLYGFTPPADP